MQSHTCSGRDDDSGCPDRVCADSLGGQKSIPQVYFGHSCGADHAFFFGRSRGHHRFECAFELEGMVSLNRISIFICWAHRNGSVDRNPYVPIAVGWRRL